LPRPTGVRRIAETASASTGTGRRRGAIFGSARGKGKSDHDDRSLFGKTKPVRVPAEKKRERNDPSLITGGERAACLAPPRRANK